MTKYLHGCDGDHAGDARGGVGESGVGECPGVWVGESEIVRVEESERGSIYLFLWD
ncbi:hypothetical protein NDA07_23380 [Microcoleus vaginatus DQ-U2]|uniref:hypothetical protein n=1 Tax=Microcoleus vaginatus TaxID=119532 RepID=UPI0016834ADA|nr:hypothetical protein [Microcoleus sp. FACHB-DQ6]